jgi:hypothetical protein
MINREVAVRVTGTRGDRALGTAAEADEQAAVVG